MGAATTAEAGLAALQGQGLTLVDFDPATGGSVAVLLTWQPASRPVDADTPVMLWVRYGDGCEEWEAGYLDTEGWRFSYSGGLVADCLFDDKPAEVLYWAQPEGPRL